MHTQLVLSQMNAFRVIALVARGAEAALKVLAVAGMAVTLYRTTKLPPSEKQASSTPKRKQ